MFKAWLISSPQWNASRTHRFPYLVSFPNSTTLCPSHKLSDGIHLKQCITLYLFILPFTMVNDLGWSTIPVVTVIAFTFMGIEGIADEIEMPFGQSSCIHLLILLMESVSGTDLCDIPLGLYIPVIPNSEHSAETFHTFDRPILSGSQGRDQVSCANTLHCHRLSSQRSRHSYTIYRLPDSTEGSHGYDDGEGDD